MRTGLIKELADHREPKGDVFRWEYLVLTRVEAQRLINDPSFVEEIAEYIKRQSMD